MGVCWTEIFNNTNFETKYIIIDSDFLSAVIYAID
jgi:hypothetical protein